MARFDVSGFDSWVAALEAIGENAEEISIKAVYAGAGVAADAIKKSVQSLPEEDFRYLRAGDTFSGVAPSLKKAALEGLGITPIGDVGGIVNARVGFDGYFHGLPSKAYPSGDIPIPLLMNSIESGTSHRQKRPVVRPAINGAKKEIKKAMEDTVNKEISKIQKG